MGRKRCPSHRIAGSFTRGSRSSTPLLIRLAAAFFILAPSHCAHAAAKPSAETHELDKVLSTLTTESASLFNWKQEGPQPIFTRPHPALAKLVSSQASDIAQRMNGKLTGDLLRDTYIRWHLMVPLLDCDASDAKASAAELLKALRTVPDYERSKPPFRKMPTWDDPVLAGKHTELYYKTIVTVGYPPFQRTIGPPESFKYMTPQQKRIADEAIELQKRLPQPKMVGGDKDAAPWNERASYVCKCLAQYRLDMLYALARSGVEKDLDTVANDVLARAKRDPGGALVSVVALDAALRDGSLSRYSEEKLRSVAGVLRKAAASNPDNLTYLTRNTTLPNAVLHLVISIESGHVPGGPKSGAAAANPLPAPATTQASVTADALTVELVNDAIERGVASLLPPPPLKPSAQADWIWGHLWQVNTAEIQGLIAWALLAAGQPFQGEPMQQHLNWVLSYDTDIAYDLATRLQVLAMLPAKGWEPYVHRDVELLAQQITTHGNFTLIRTGAARDEFGNNAEGQYGVMGLWAGHRRGAVVKPELWLKVDHYWRAAQLPSKEKAAAGWGLYSNEPLAPAIDRVGPPYGPTGPMTAAGLMALTRTEHVLLSSQRLELGSSKLPPMTPEFQRGMNWLDQHFSFDALSGDEDNIYYMWTIQNVGQATGYRTFNKVDWFRDATTRLLNQQGLNGVWSGPKGPGASTAFALLYLARARGPLAICKLRFGESWNNRPADLFNFTEYLSDSFETPTSWQIDDLNQPVYELIESPLLYLATDKSFTLTAEQVSRLRDYITAGGMLVCAPEGHGSSSVARSMKALAAQLYPGLQPVKVDKQHPFFNLQQKVQANVNLVAVQNSVRPLVVIFDHDLSHDLQADDARSRESFKLLANIYLYATGKDARRPRIGTNYLAPTTRPAPKSLEIARIKIGEDFDPEPAALPQLKAFLAREHGIDLKLSTAAPSALASQRVAFLTITPGTNLSDGEGAALRKWLDAGGTLWLDAAGGAEAVSALEQALAKVNIKPDDVAPLRAEHPFITGQGLPSGWDLRRPTWRPFARPKTPGANLFAARIGNREAIYIARHDLTSGLAGLNHWSISGLEPTFARRLLANAMVATLFPPPPPLADTQPATTSASAPTSHPVTEPSTLPAPPTSQPLP